MRFRGKEIDPLKLWGEYCDIKPDNGTFLSLTFCPNPNHDNSRSPAFQINITRPTVHCFSNCGISGSYEHAICVIEGLYDKFKVTDDDISRFRIAWQPGEASEITQSRNKVRRVYKQARKFIYSKSLASKPLGRINRAGVERIQQRRTDNLQSRGRKQDTERVLLGSVVGELELANYSYLPKRAMNYLKYRGISASSRTRWQIGFDEELDRITIPVFDNRNRLQFVIKRSIDGSRPPYLYPDDSVKTALLFGACNLDRAMVGSQGLVLVEGSLDCIALHQHGYKNTVALLGNSLSEKQLHEIVRLNPKRVYLFFDKDGAGVRGMEKAAKLLQSKYSLKVPLYPKGDDLDPAKLTFEQVTKAFRKAVPVLRVMKRKKEIEREFV